jgi:hypothetical protein
VVSQRAQLVVAQAARVVSDRSAEGVRDEHRGRIDLQRLVETGLVEVRQVE